jgi:hypothetical protein
MKVTIKQDPENVVEQPVLAEAIIAMSKSMDRLLYNKLNRKAIVTLVAADTKLSRRDISLVMDSLHDLAKTYTK